MTLARVRVVARIRAKARAVIGLGLNNGYSNLMTS